jgi:hypothetical protein
MYFCSLVHRSSFSERRKTLKANLAQLVEQRYRKPQVAGSNPVVGSTKKSKFKMLHLLLNFDF